jgi:pyrroline-5-carboxylate reductase
MQINTIGFIGAGNMAEAIIKGILQSGALAAEKIYISDIKQSRLIELHERYQINFCATNQLLVEKADCIFLAIKPQNSTAVLEKIKLQNSHKIFISIMAGKTISFIKSHLGDVPVMRIMPNTPILVGAGMSVIASGTGIDKKILSFIKKIFKAVGEVIELNETDMDIVTAVSGSGPAYVYNFAAAMIAGAIHHGLSRDTAEILVKQTFLGASKMMVETSESAEQLAEQVTSKGGTTEAALKVFADSQCDGIIYAMLKAAKDRAKAIIL